MIVHGLVINSPIGAGIVNCLNANVNTPSRPESVEITAKIPSVTNTVILLVSALTMGLGLLKMRVGDVKGAKLMIWATILLATAFLVIKGFEWTAEYNHGVFLLHDKLLVGTENSLPFGQKLFFGMYFTMTGLHGFHIIIGIGLMLWLLKRINAGKVSTDHHILYWNIALYWDIVHLIWVFVFPYYYMIGAGGVTGGH